MPTSHRVKYKNYCIPQEGITLTDGLKWYLDSDCGKKMSGEATLDINEAANTPWYVKDVSATDTATADLFGVNSWTFFYIKNTGGGSGDDIHMALDGSHFYISLSAGECFASKISDTARVRIVISDVAKVEYWSALTS